MRHLLSAHGSNALEFNSIGKAIARCAACALWSFFVACSVDDRTLTSTDAIANGGMGSQSGAFGAGANGSDGGAAGEAPLPVCTYPGNSVANGCETRVSNPGFTSNVAGWIAEAVGVLESWQQDDANGDPGSGSLLVVNSNYSDLPDSMSGTAGGGARQCITLTGGEQLYFAADVFIPKDQGAGYMGNTYVSVATLSMFFYTDAGCQGQTASNVTSVPVRVTDKWVHVETSAHPPLGAQSVAVRLATLKPFPQFDFQAEFDNVFVREQ